VTDWPVSSLGRAGPQIVNLNETGGQPFQAGDLATFTGGSPNVTGLEGPGSRDQLSVVDAYTWRAEGGFGGCWRNVGAIVPELWCGKRQAQTPCLGR